MLQHHPYSPLSRLFTLLDILQSRPGVTAAQLSERLQVEARSVRRYMTMLRDLGIPVEAARGRYGGYRLRSGFRLPPLMWTEEEALAVTLGLQVAQQLGLTETVPTVESALAKVERVLPPALRERVQAVQERVVLSLATKARIAPTSYVVGLSAAAHQGRVVHLRYRAQGEEETERDFNCYGLVYYDDHCYAVGYCHLRRDTRILRLDRIHELQLEEERFQPPQNFDCLAYTVDTFAAIPSRWLAEVLLYTTVSSIREAIPAAFATLEETSKGVLLRAYDDDLDHTARFLIGLGYPFAVLRPPELVEALHRLARTILEMTPTG
jgi:predicted DNA-binding transcriptional regulator YafY